jgi:type 1 glutamine amidotransferase
MIKKILITILISTLFLASYAQQKKVLIFSKTARYYHESIPAGIAAIKKLGIENNFGVDETKDSADFNDQKLSAYAAVIFLSPSGNILDTVGKMALKKFIQKGGGFVGIHAASTIEKNWTWYGQLVGGVFTGHPEPQEAVVLVQDKKNNATKHLPLQWKRKDEWYNFRDRPSDLHVLLTVDEKTYKGGNDGAYHPLAWYHEFDGGRSFYTALGHFPEAYQDPLFLKHILAGINYAIKK